MDGWVPKLELNLDLKKGEQYENALTDDLRLIEE